jgi:hypothetical protein
MRRERFVEELDSYSKQLEEFQTFGEMSEVPKYLKKTQALHQRLESAADKVVNSSILTQRRSYLSRTLEYDENSSSCHLGCF